MIGITGKLLAKIYEPFSDRQMYGFELYRGINVFENAVQSLYLFR